MVRIFFQYQANLQQWKFAQIAQKYFLHFATGDQYILFEEKNSNCSSVVQFTK